MYLHVREKAGRQAYVNIYTSMYIRRCLCRFRFVCLFCVDRITHTRYLREPQLPLLPSAGQMPRAKDATRAAIVLDGTRHKTSPFKCSGARASQNSGPERATLRMRRTSSSSRGETKDVQLGPRPARTRPRPLTLVFKRCAAFRTQPSRAHLVPSQKIRPRARSP